MFDLISAFPSRLCKNSKSEVRAAINNYLEGTEANKENERRGIEVEDKRKESGHIRRFEQSAKQLLKLIRQKKVTKKAVRDSEVFKTLCRVVEQKEKAQPESSDRKRHAQDGTEPQKYKRIIVNEDMSQEFGEIDAIDTLNEPTLVAMNDDYDMNHDYDQELPPKARSEDSSIDEEFLSNGDDLAMNDVNGKPKVIVEYMKDVQQRRMLDIKTDEGLSTGLEAEPSQVNA